MNGILMARDLLLVRTFVAFRRLSLFSSGGAVRRAVLPGIAAVAVVVVVGRASHIERLELCFVQQLHHL